VRVEIDKVLYDEDDKVHSRKKARGDNHNDDHKKMIKI